MKARTAVIFASSAFVVSIITLLITTTPVVVAQSSKALLPAPLHYLHSDGADTFAYTNTPTLMKSFAVPAYTFRDAIIIMFDYGYSYAGNAPIIGTGNIYLRIDGKDVKTLNGFARGVSNLSLYGADSCTVYTLEDTVSAHTIELWGETNGYGVIHNNLFMIMGI